jgi:hypothetical protein
MEIAGRILIAFGAVLVVAGLVLSFGIRIPLLGKLPGDIYIKKENVEFYFPLATSLLLSVAISGVLWIVSYFQRRGS